jgi:hypothetical protein
MTSLHQCFGYSFILQAGTYVFARDVLLIVASFWRILPRNDLIPAGGRPAGWAAIAEPLGVSRQSAWERFS